MMRIALDKLLALGAGGSAGMVCHNGRYLGVVGAENMVELDEEAEAYVNALLAPGRTRRRRASETNEPVETPDAPPEDPVEE